MLRTNLIFLIAILGTSIAQAEVICNFKSEKTNLRKGPSAKNYDVAAALTNGAQVEKIETVTNQDGYDYIKVRFKNPNSGASEIAYVYHESVHEGKECGNPPGFYDDDVPGSFEAQLQKEEEEAKIELQKWREFIRLLKLKKIDEANNLLRTIDDQIVYKLNNYEKVGFLLVRGVLYHEDRNYKKAISNFYNLISIRMNGAKPFGIEYEKRYDDYIASAFFRAGIIMSNEDQGGSIGEYNEELGRTFIVTAAELGDAEAKKYISDVNAALRRIYEEKRAAARRSNHSRSGGAYSYRPSNEYVVKCRDRRLFGGDSRTQIPLGTCTGYESECEQKFRNQIEATGSMVTFCRKQLGSEFVTDGISKK